MGLFTWNPIVLHHNMFFKWLKQNVAIIHPFIFQMGDIFLINFGISCLVPDWKNEISNFFPRWSKCAPLTFFSLLPIKNCFLDKILCPWLNIFLHTATFSYLLTNKIINSWIYWLNNSSSFPLIVEPMLIFVWENDQILQRSKIFTVFLILFQCFKIIP